MKTRKKKKYLNRKTRKTRKMKTRKRHKRYNIHKKTKKGGYLEIFEKTHYNPLNSQDYQITINNLNINFDLHAAKHLDSFQDYTIIQSDYDTDVTMMSNDETQLMPKSFIDFIKQKLKIMNLTTADFSKKIEHPKFKYSTDKLYILTKHNTCILYQNYHEKPLGNGNMSRGFKLVSIFPEGAWEDLTIWDNSVKPLFMEEYLKLSQSKNVIIEEIKIQNDKLIKNKSQIQKLQNKNQAYHEQIIVIETEIQDIIIEYNKSISFLKNCNAFFETLKNVEKKSFCKELLTQLKIDATRTTINEKFITLLYFITKSSMPQIKHIDDNNINEKKRIYNLYVKDNIKDIKILCQKYLSDLSSQKSSQASSKMPSELSSQASSELSSQEEGKSSLEPELSTNITNINNIIHLNNQDIANTTNEIENNNNINIKKNEISDINNNIIKNTNEIKNLQEEIKNIIPTNILELENQINEIDRQIQDLKNPANPKL